MSLGIRARLFLALLIATGAVVGSMYLFTQWSFERGFIEYVRQQEERRIQAIAERLEGFYADNGSWDALHENRRLWWRLLSAAARPEPPPGAPLGMPMHRFRGGEQYDDMDDEHRRPPPPPPDQALPFALRVQLLDVDQRVLVGPAETTAEPLERRPLKFGEALIGYLAFQPERRLSDHLDRDFASRQGRAFVVIALLAVLVSGLLAFPLAHRFVRPVRELQRVTRRLAGGDYAARTEIRGHDEIGRLAQDFNELARALERTEAQRRQWVADISHELRTPLAVLRGEIEALVDGVRAVGPETLASLHAESLHLGRLIEDLYELSMSDIGALRYRKVGCDALEPLRDAIVGQREEFAEARIRVDAEGLPTTPVTVFADPDRLAQLYKNLLINTRRYTDPDGVLQVAAAVHGPVLHIDLEDSAPGVPGSELGHLFERFYRVESSRNRATGGAGLGLAICANIVAAHDGRIEARPSALGGLWIHIELPLPPI